MPEADDCGLERRKPHDGMPIFVRIGTESRRRQSQAGPACEEMHVRQDITRYQQPITLAKEGNVARCVSRRFHDLEAGYLIPIAEKQIDVTVRSGPHFVTEPHD